MGRMMQWTRGAVLALAVMWLGACAEDAAPPAVDKGKPKEAKKDRTDSKKDLAAIHRGVRSYVEKQGARKEYPSALSRLYDSGIIPDKGAFVSDLDPSPRPMANGVPSSYESCFDKYPDRQFTDNLPGNLPMAWEREAFSDGKRAVVFFDSHTEEVDEARFQELMKALDEAVKKLTKPVPPAK